MSCLLCFSLETLAQDDQELVFKIINKDSGEVVGDIRDEQHRDIPFDVLPRGFRPAEAWHPELQVQHHNLSYRVLSTLC